ncbi:flagellar basal body-associated FliL family protein [Shimia sp. R11_0]|uniref:flagellar basal body-associated FliL family protein n=1 Tax=Shimia sp. R11_0 TaxID=2821096 RepID=UPI001AD9B0D0|nr:flagellar basal body-associated FliL family protein [Shimia sp. R11_0]MBO9476281.1 flagellar basal body-associated FliL family protein [Shimia sp. R11_0]
MKKLLPIILLLVGVGGGVGAGLALRPEPTPPPAEEHMAETDEKAAAKTEKPPKEEGPPSGREYVDLNDQFIIPVVDDDAVSSLILVTLTLEVDSGERESIYQAEPRIRGALLQTMFDHANAGGFHGAFTNSSKLEPLRRTFLEVAQNVYGDEISDVLIIQITRQDVP